MNHYTLSELAVGQSENFTVTVTQEMMEDFYRLTGDDSPIHRSEEYAAGRGYPGRVVYGMLGASFFSTLAGVYLPGSTACSTGWRPSSPAPSLSGKPSP